MDENNTVLPEETTGPIEETATTVEGEETAAPAEEATVEEAPAAE